MTLGKVIKSIIFKQNSSGLGFNGNGRGLLKNIRHVQDRGDTASILYFDIARFRELEQVNGSKAAEKVLSLLKAKLDQQIPGTFSNFQLLAIENLWGDDFIAVITNQGPPDTKLLEELALTSRINVIQSLDRETINLCGHPLELHVGYASISTDNNLKLESRIYSAIREAHNVAKGKLDLKFARLLPEFKEIIAREQLSVVYQPLVSMHSGGIMGWEALVRGPENSPFHPPAVIFDLAEKSDLLYAVERICRKHAINNIGRLGPGQKLFLNIHPRTITDPGFVSGETLNFIKNAGFQPENVVFEITERHHIQDYVLFNDTLRHYRKQGYLVAIDDMGAGFSSLQSIAEIKPEYLKVDMSIVRDINTSKVKRALLETFVTFAEKMGCMIIAEGIETSQELITLMDIGIHYGQGFFLARPSFPKPLLNNNIIFKLSKTHFKQTDRTGVSSITAKNIMDAAVQVESDTPVAKIKELLDANEPSSGVVIVDKKDKPLGLLMRYYLDHLLGSQYGIPLYFHRPVSEVMDNLPLVVDKDTPIEQLSQVAMGRDKKKIYDSVIVTTNGLLAGIISVHKMLDTLTRIQVEIAKGANPLTGLPGNVAIEQKFSELCRDNIKCAMIYTDLDYFKPYNDRYGFEKGDEVILFTSRLLQSILKKYASQSSFLGHIGGDDFVLFVEDEKVDLICRKIITYFDRLIVRFYSKEDREKKGFEGYDRNGEKRWFPLISISLAVIDCLHGSCKNFDHLSRKASQLKRYAKSLEGSVYVKERRNND